MINLTINLLSVKLITFSAYVCPKIFDKAVEVENRVIKTSTKIIRRTLLRFYIKTLKQRLDAINQLRVDRTLAAMGPAFRQVYSLLPTLLHHHHPKMPGYLEGKVPYGISFYMTDESQLRYFQSIKLQLGKEVSLFPEVEMPITGVYSMGSTSSIGQNTTSDLDIWVCHQSWLDNEERLALQKKCQLLENWCLSMGIKVSLFLIDENSFRSNKNDNFSKKDYCSSHQHILLLDEFYRTAVRMAGKRILWNMIPGEEEENYDEYVLLLYERGALTPNEWLDLGGLNTLSAEEYFGASLWQFYKSIDSPYKAVLKTILLEAYSWKHPHTCLLAMDIKKRLHNGEIVSFGLDSYCMMLERVTQYLISIDDYVRLDLVRRCFYLKVREKLSLDKNSQRSGWRRKVLAKLVSEWGWDKARITILDSHTDWKIERVQEVHNELLDAMIQSYYNLIIHFASRNNLGVNTTSLYDTSMLVCKLCTAIETMPDKITFLVQRICPTLQRSV